MHSLISTIHFISSLYGILRAFCMQTVVISGAGHLLTFHLLSSDISDTKDLFDHISKHREESLKMRRVVEWQTSRCLKIWSDTIECFIMISSQSNLNWPKLRKRRRNKIVDYLWWLRSNILTPSRSWSPLLMSLRTNSTYFGRFNPAAHVFIKLRGIFVRWRAIKRSTASKQ